MSGATAPGDDRRRCFLALLPDAASRAALQQSRAVPEYALAGGTRSVRWVKPDALHLTLRFLGDTDAAQIEYFRRTLPALAPPLPALTARRYGIWPNRARPRLLVLELGADPTLAKLAAECEVHARKAGFAPERRDFRAHITLARLRPGCAFGIVPNPHVAVTLGQLALMESVLDATAATYTPLASIPLSRT